MNHQHRQQAPLVSRQTLLNNKVDLRSSDFVVSQVMTTEAAAPQRGACIYWSSIYLFD